jgi:phosphatidylinositol alpha-mannosyltransferase
VRVALACPYAWDAPGGVQVHVRELSEHLRARGHDVVVIAPGTRPSTDTNVRIIGRPVRIPFNGSVVPISPDPRSRRTIRRGFEDFAPDVVHVHEPFSPSTGMFAALAATAPVVATFHAYADRSVALAAFAPLLRPVWNRLSVRLAVSNAAAQFAGRHFKGPIRVVPNGLDIEPFRDAQPASLSGSPRLLFVGRLEPRKGFRFAVRAFRMLAEEFPESILVVAGDGPEKKAVLELPPEIRERVVMPGAVSRSDLPHYHAAADVFLAPNTGGESFGMVLLEAMAAGLPVVASDIPGYREVLRHEVEGLLVPARDPAALAHAARRLLLDPALARSLGAAGRVRAERFAWPVVATEIESAYREALATAPH